MAVAQGSRNNTSGDQGRLLGRAIVASILAHALILILAPGWLDKAKSRAPVPPALVAHLLQPRPAPASTPTPVPETLPRRVQPEATRKPPPVERAQPILTAPPAPTPALVQAPTAAPAVPGVERPRTPEPVSAPSTGVVAAPTAKLDSVPAAAPAAPAASDSADPATLGQYRIAIISAARRYKRYPRLAIDNNWEGQAEIRMVIGVDGNIASITIKSRSGFDVLDQQALEMIRKAKPLTPIPPALRGRGFTIDVPVVFSLKEETG